MISFGWGNGYVVIGKEHPLFGEQYADDIYPHGGVTYSQEIHNIEVGGTMVKHGWIFGFDTAHANDTLANCPKEYVIDETKKFAKQLEEYNE